VELVELVQLLEPRLVSSLLLMTLGQVFEEPEIVSSPPWVKQRTVLGQLILGSLHQVRQIQQL
jgi:hypothetical protein